MYSSTNSIVDAFICIILYTKELQKNALDLQHVSSFYTVFQQRGPVVLCLGHRFFSCTGTHFMAGANLLSAHRVKL